MANNKFNSVHFLAFSYVISVYLSVILFYLISSPDIYWILFAPVVVAFVILIFLIKNRNYLDQTALLDGTVLIKYSLIPYYLLGFCGIVMSLLLSLIPVPFMIVAGPATAILLSVIGYCILLCSSLIPITYIVKTYQNGQMSFMGMLFSLISQFIFILDVLSVMVLTYKENRYKTSFIVLLLSLCFMIFIIYSFCL